LPEVLHVFTHFFRTENLDRKSPKYGGLSTEGSHTTTSLHSHHVKKKLSELVHKLWAMGKVCWKESEAVDDLLYLLQALLEQAVASE